MKSQCLLMAILCLALPETGLALPGDGGLSERASECQRGRKKRKKKKAAQDEDGNDASAQSPAAGPTLQRSNRMEFDGRLVKGERASGAVYLFSKARRPLPPLLKFQRDRLDDIVWPVLRRSIGDVPVVETVPVLVPKVQDDEPKTSKRKKKTTKKSRKSRRKKKARKGSKR